MTSDKRDDKLAARTREKAENLYERLGPNFRTGSPNYLTKVKSQIERDPVEAYDNVRDVSRGADFNQSRVNQQKGGSYSGNKKRDRHKEIEQVLIGLAQAHGKHDPQNPNYTAVRDRVVGKLKIWSERNKRREAMSEAERSDYLAQLTPEVRKQIDEDLAPDVEALDHLAGLSERRIYDIIREHRDSLLPEISLSPKA